MNAENKFLLEKIRIMAKQVENNLKKKEEIKEKEKKEFINEPAGQRVDRLNNSHISWRNSLRSPW
tara:strand:- start:323 stop:517 length:195 start_codon:yes stop_codon:yes gene_type:complete